jgi:hypothetical protein
LPGAKVMGNGPLLALPPESVTGDPKGCPFVRNWTVPVRVPLEPLEVSVTVAVNVTASPNTDGLSDEATAVELLAMFTVCPPLNVPVLLLKFPSPL